MLKKITLIFTACFFAVAVNAAPLSYNLKAEKIAENTWIFQGVLEDFSNKNGGNIVNTAFIVTEEGVVVIDTGPSVRYGKAMRKAIEEITDKPIKVVYNTHHHPDHFLGNQAFSDVDIQALPETGKQIAIHGDAFATNLYQMVGDWMRSTEVFLPSNPVKGDELKLGTHNLKLMGYTGHTGSDLVILDQKTGVLFASDMVFYQRALTTPHTPGLNVWLDEIDNLRSIKYSLVVPGHGPLVTDASAFDQMSSYLSWLDQVLTESAKAGLSMTEVMKLPIKDEFKNVALNRREFARTVVHLYPKYEEKYF
ncbi:quinoprotein relay system zinc metallohydrolase 1 [Neptuniibacter sp.]|uniref:quinoprotein relay system zinc metallohydrolase 1 n=1 Tax=Neptuniibacter sp. TaxID=1962643 RepID=UPI0026267E7E|nr:quinoprotein relay system zinc metallohydrolase 1 [Neptuniibacter sp.]MCP4595825.1 quinoprotein relay system zinc metallohydrolase 1 [Neptuniibacter sp.]